MSILRHASRFCADRLYEIRWLYAGVTVVLLVAFGMDRLMGLIMSSLFMDAPSLSAPESLLLWAAVLGPTLLWPAVILIGLCLLWLSFLGAGLRREGLSFRQYGELSDEDADRLHLRTAAAMGPRS